MLNAYWGPTAHSFVLPVQQICFSDWEIIDCGSTEPFIRWSQSTWQTLVVCLGETKPFSTSSGWYLESRVKSTLQLLEKAAKCYANITNKYQMMFSGVKAKTFLFSYITTLRGYNNEVVGLHLFVVLCVFVVFPKLRCVCPPKYPDNFTVASMSPGSHPGLCSHFPMLLRWKVAHPTYQLGISLTHGHSLGNMRLPNGLVLQTLPLLSNEVC